MTTKPKALYLYKNAEFDVIQLYNVEYISDYLYKVAEELEKKGLDFSNRSTLVKMEICAAYSVCNIDIGILKRLLETPESESWRELREKIIKLIKYQNLF